MEPICCRECGAAFTPRTSSTVMCGAQECIKASRKRTWESYKKRNPEAGKIASRKWRDKHPDKPYEWPSKRENGNYVREYKSKTPCFDCGGIFPSECMDFDHRVSGEKVNNVGTMVAHGWSREKIDQEIAKCDLVCANCHRIRTRKRRIGND